MALSDEEWAEGRRRRAREGYARRKRASGKSSGHKNCGRPRYTPEELRSLIRARKAEYYRRHKAEILAKQRARYVRLSETPEWAEARRVSSRVRAAKYRSAQPAKYHDVHLRHRYGVRYAEYDELLRSQGGLCAICGERPPGTRRLHLDHDHASGTVRGLLCGRCNQGIGHFRDDPALIGAAIGYLRGHAP